MAMIALATRQCLKYMYSYILDIYTSSIPHYYIKTYKFCYSIFLLQIKVKLIHSSHKIKYMLIK